MRRRDGSLLEMLGWENQVEEGQGEDQRKDVGQLKDIQEQYRNDSRRYRRPQ